MKKLQAKGQLEVSSKIRREQRKLIQAQRKVESIRILDALFERIRVSNKTNHYKYSLNNNINQQLEESLNSGKSSKKLYEENSDRLKLINKYKQATEELFNQQKEKLEETKSKSSLRAILKKDTPKTENNSSQEKELHKERKKKGSSSEDEFKVSTNNQHVNPFKNVCTPEMAAEWLKMNIMAYPPIFPGIQMYPPVSYRGSGAPFRGGRGGFRGRGRGTYHSGSSYYEDSGYSNGYRNRRSRSRSRSRPRANSRSRSRLVFFILCIILIYNLTYIQDQSPDDMKGIAEDHGPVHMRTLGGLDHIDPGHFHMMTPDGLDHTDQDPENGLEKGHRPPEMLNYALLVDLDLHLDGHVRSPGVVRGPKVLRKWLKSLWNLKN